MSQDMPIQPPCLNLRAKRAYGDVHSDIEPSWNSGLLATDCYWCLKTMEAWGPDDQPALPESCATQRPCYEQFHIKRKLA